MLRISSGPLGAACIMFGTGTGEIRISVSHNTWSPRSLCLQFLSVGACYYLILRVGGASDSYNKGDKAAVCMLEARIRQEPGRARGCPSST
jgi:hypothetical protein